MGDDVFDLFGIPVRDGHGKRGRPPFEVTERIRNKVKMLLAMGWSLTRIARAISASPATVKRYFRAELKEREAMRDRLDAERLMQVYELAAAGNVGAHRELQRLMDRNDRMVIEDRMGRPEPQAEKPVPIERVGKKESAQQLAMSVDAELDAELNAEAGHVRH